MKAEELIPEEPTFTLNGKEYHLNVPKFHEQLWISRQGDLKDLLEQSQWLKLCKIVYKFLIEKDLFLSDTKKMIDDEGRYLEVTISGPEKLYFAIETQEEAGKMLGALFTALAAANPIVQEKLNDLKKNLKANQIGEKSLT